MQVTLFSNLFTDTSPAPVLSEIGIEMQRHFLQAEAYELHFQCKKELYRSQFFVIKQQINKPSSRQRNAKVITFHKK